MINILRKNRALRAGVLVAAGAAMALQGGATAATDELSPAMRHILDSKEITMITTKSHHSYYIYRGQPMGFEYDLAREFADQFGLRLKVLAVNSWDEMVAALSSGRGDFIAAGLEITADRSGQVAFSRTYQEAQPQLISNRRLSAVTSPSDLAGKTVDVSRGSAAHERLKELRSQGIDVVIRDHDRVPIDHLIQRVARGEIDFAVTNSNVAMLSQRYYPSAIVRTAIHGSLMLGWAVDPRSGDLLERINGFFQTISETGRLNDIYEKYHWNIGDFDYIDLTTFHERLRTRLPRYRPFIKDAAVKNGFDWCLLAAQIYRESHMDPEAVGLNGSRGLMQILPATGRSLKLADPSDPVANIKAGAQYLKSLYDLYEEAGEEDRLMLALAAYNCGPGHLQDARRLAVQKGLDPNRWDSLTKTLPLLRYRSYHKTTEHGYCRGDITVAYVKHILTYYDILKRHERDTAIAKSMVASDRGKYRSN
jgi:membrane-bound lytic murein transglycosylase F